MPSDSHDEPRADRETRAAELEKDSVLAHLVCEEKCTFEKRHSKSLRRLPTGPFILFFTTKLFFKTQLT